MGHHPLKHFPLTTAPDWYTAPDNAGIAAIKAKTDTIAWGDITWLVNIIKYKKVIEKIGATWRLRVYDNATPTPNVVLDKVLMDPAGNDITDIAAGLLAQELASSV